MKKLYLVRTIILAGSLLLQLNTLCFHSRGAAGDVDLSFDPGSGVNGTVNAVVVQPDGKLIIGGNFTTVKGLSRTNIARLNADGGGDGTFNPGTVANGQVSSVALHSDGKVLIAGSNFDSVNGVDRYLVARLNSDGTLDHSVIPGTGADPYGSGYASSVVQPDGKVVLGGYFNDYFIDELGGVWLFSRPRIVRLNTNGTFDTSFAYIPSAEEYMSVSSMALQPDGKVLIARSTFGAHGTNPYGITRLNANGGWDSSFNPAGAGVGGFSYDVLCVALQSDGKVLIGGTFSTVNGTNRFGIARLNANGSLDSSFNPGTGAYGVSSVALQTDGKVLIGGSFTTVNGTNRNHIARLNADGSLDSTFNPGTGADGTVRSIALQSDGNVLIGGDFLTVNGVMRPHVARLYGDSAPLLNIVRSNASVIVSWPVTGLNFQLQESTDLSLPNSWSPVAQSTVTNAGQISVTVPTTVGRKFFRLKSQ